MLTSTLKTYEQVWGLGKKLYITVKIPKCEPNYNNNNNVVFNVCFGVRSCHRGRGRQI